MLKKSKYYIRPDGLHEKIKVINHQRVAFRGRSDAEVDRKMIAYRETQKRGRKFSAVADDWWAWIEPDIESNTAGGYKAPLHRAKMQFGDQYIRQITALDVDRYIKEFAKSHTPKTTKTQLQIVKQIFNHALLIGDIEFNSIVAVSLPKKVVKQPRHMPPEDEIKIIQESAAAPYGLFALTAAYTGCRPGEVLALKGTDIDRENKTISVTKSVCFVNRKPVIKEPKTVTGKRTVPLLDVLDCALPEKLPAGYLFSEDKGKTPMGKTAHERMWEAYREATGVTASPYQLRHAFSSLAYDAGLEPKQLQEIMGHKNISTSMDTYTELMKRKKLSSAEKLNSYFNGQNSPSTTGGHTE